MPRLASMANLRLSSGGRTAALVLTLAFLAACGSDSGGRKPTSGSAPPPASVPRSGDPTPLPTTTTSRPTSGPNKVDGDIFSFATGQIDNAAIDLWVDVGRVGSTWWGYSWWWANGPLRSDGIGHFVAGNLPASRITILGFKSGFVQPCAVRHDVPSNIAVRIEMIPVSTLETFNPPRPQLSSEPSLTGVIFETTPAGRQPVDGVELQVEEVMGALSASTRSNRGGGFFLCNLGGGAYIFLSKSGFEEKWVGPFDVSTESKFLEIEMKRLSAS